MHDTSLPPEIPQGTIRVKSNAMLFKNPENATENLFATSSDPGPHKVEADKPSIVKNAFYHHERAIELREESPEPTKYLIPQDMLMSSSEKVKVVERKPVPSPVNVATDYNFDDMFVMELEPEEEKSSPTKASVPSILLRHKRKASIVPKDDDGIEFDAKRAKPAATPLPRPQENIDLIENLATYRVYVAALLKKLKMPPMDFSEESSEYINTYKIYRN